jgi:sugar O-acyltransferase (sialic acid O-acetyltransferase NeuD family)
LTGPVSLPRSLEAIGMARVVIFGSGIGADTAFRYLSQDSPHEVCAFTVDAAFLTTHTFHGLPVVDYESVVTEFPPDQYEMFVPLGFQRMNRLRAEKYLDAKRKGYRFVSYLNSRHYTLEGVKIGENCFILDSQIFNLDVTIGDNVMIWSGNHFGDRAVIGDHAWISSHVTLAGDVAVGDYCFLGVNAAVSNNVTLGPGTFVGASVLIAQSTLEGSVHLAQPAKSLPISSEKFVTMLKLGGG